MRIFDDIYDDILQALRINDVAALKVLADEILDHATDTALAVNQYVHGAISRLSGDSQQAIVHYKKSYAIYEQLHDLRGLGNVACGLGIAYEDIGDLDEALRQLQTAANIFQELGQISALAQVTGNLGALYYTLGDYSLAYQYYKKAIGYREELGKPEEAAVSIGNLGVLLYSLGDYAEALENYNRALKIHELSGDKYGVARLLGNIGNIHLTTGNHDLALEYYDKALKLRETLGDQRSIPTIYANMGNVFFDRQDHQAALTYYQRALEIRRAQGNRIHELMDLGNVIAALLRLNETKEAEQLLDHQESFELIDPTVRLQFFRNRADLCERHGDLDRAIEYLQKGLSTSRELGNRSDAASYHERLRNLAQKRNDFSAYIEHNNEFLRITEEIRGQEATRKLAMIEARQSIEAERAEKEKHRALLHNTLPPAIADRVLRGEQVNDTFDQAVVLFMDLVGFTSMSSSMDPNDVVNLLSDIFTTCDAIVATHGLMKIKTIGDSYMAVAFPPESSSSEERLASITDQAAHAAIDMRDKISRISLPSTSPAGSHVMVRIGIHSGPVTAGVIGTERLQYDVWGDTVNVASRMESTGEPGKIHVSHAFASSLMPGTCHLELRGETELKGKGKMTTYWLGTQQ